MYGNYDSSRTSNLVIVFEKCDPRTSSVPCKSEEEIEDWMYFKYLVVFSNQKKFQSHKFSDDKINAEAEVTWYPLNAKTRSEYVHHITRISIELRDMLFDIGSWTAFYDTGFLIERKPNREMPYRNRF